MKEGVLDILIYLFENYFDAESDDGFEPDRETLRRRTAHAGPVGDDTLQRRSQGTVVPETFTHGTSQQRVTWFRRGLQSGSVAECDTFKAGAP